MSKKRFLVILLTTFCVGLLGSLSYWFLGTKKQLQSIALPQAASQGPVVVLTSLYRTGGGLERSIIAQHKALWAAGVQSILILPRTALTVPMAKETGLPLVLCDDFALKFGSFIIHPGLASALQKIVKEYGSRIMAIHCNSDREVYIAKRTLGKTAIPIIFTQHRLAPLKKSVRMAVDGMIGVSPLVAGQLKEQNEKDGLSKPLCALPPFFETDRFLNFTTTESRAAFFLRAFGVQLKPCPLLVKVAHLYKNVQAKNHPLLFQAMHDLIYKQHLPVQVALAGRGDNQPAYEKMVDELGLRGYVYFLGETDLTPALFYHADIALLAGREEAFGIALAEGGLLKKPTIIADGAGAAGWLIEDGITGFLFQANNAQSLAQKIAYVAMHPATAALCGERLQYKILNSFSGIKIAQRLIAFYKYCKEQQNSCLKTVVFMHRYHSSLLLFPT